MISSRDIFLLFKKKKEQLSNRLNISLSLSRRNKISHRKHKKYLLLEDTHLQSCIFGIYLAWTNLKIVSLLESNINDIFYEKYISNSSEIFLLFINVMMNNVFV